MNRFRPLLRSLLLPTLSGVLYFLSWIGFGIWPLAFVCLLPLLWSLREATPLQALTLQNAPFLLHQSEIFAARVAKDAGTEPDRQVDVAYQLALCRPPTPRERALSLAYLQKRGVGGLQDFCHALFNLNEFVYVP